MTVEQNPDDRIQVVVTWNVVQFVVDNASCAAVRDTIHYSPDGLAFGRDGLNVKSWDFILSLLPKDGKSVMQQLPMLALT